MIWVFEMHVALPFIVSSDIGVDGEIIEAPRAFHMIEHDSIGDSFLNPQTNSLYSLSQCTSVPPRQTS